MSASDIPGSDIPSKVEKIWNAVTKERFGYTFVDNPVGWVLAVVIAFIVDEVTSAFALIALTLIDLWTLWTDLAVETGAIWIEPGEDLAGLLERIVSVINNVLVDLATMTGPFAPYAVIVFWGLLFGALAKGVELFIEARTGGSA